MTTNNIKYIDLYNLYGYNIDPTNIDRNTMTDHEFIRAYNGLLYNIKREYTKIKKEIIGNLNRILQKRYILDKSIFNIDNNNLIEFRKKLLKSHSNKLLDEEISNVNDILNNITIDETFIPNHICNLFDLINYKIKKKKYHNNILVFYIKRFLIQDVLKDEYVEKYYKLERLRYLLCKLDKNLHCEDMFSGTHYIRAGKNRIEGKIYNFLLQNMKKFKINFIKHQFTIKLEHSYFFDFMVLFNDSSILFIEIDDKSHTKPDVIYRDRLKNVFVKYFLMCELVRIKDFEDYSMIITDFINKLNFV